MRVKDLMHNTKILDRSANVLDVAINARSEKLGSVLIFFDENAEDVNERYGIVTETDVLYRVIAEGKDYNTEAVKIMSYPIHTIDANAKLREAAMIFNLLRIRRLPVVEKNKIIGMITARDIAKYFIFVFDEFMRIIRYEKSSTTNPLIVPVESLIHEPIIVDKDTTVYEAAKIMKKQRENFVFVDKGEGEKLNEKYGLLTDRDIFYKVVAENKDYKNTTVSEIMRNIRIVMSADECICDASKYMNLYEIRTIPVKKGDKLIGVITAKDVAKFSAFAFTKILEKLREIDPIHANTFEDEYW